MASLRTSTGTGIRKRGRLTLSDLPMIYTQNDVKRFSQNLAESRAVSHSMIETEKQKSQLLVQNGKNAFDCVLEKLYNRADTSRRPSSHTIPVSPPPSAMQSASSALPLPLRRSSATSGSGMFWYGHSGCTSIGPQLGTWSASSLSYMSPLLSRASKDARERAARYRREEELTEYIQHVATKYDAHLPVHLKTAPSKIKYERCKLYRKLTPRLSTTSKETQHGTPSRQEDGTKEESREEITQESDEFEQREAERRLSALSERTELSKTAETMETAEEFVTAKSELCHDTTADGEDTAIMKKPSGWCWVDDATITHTIVSEPSADNAEDSKSAQRSSKGGKDTTKADKGGATNKRSSVLPSNDLPAEQSGKKRKSTAQKKELEAVDKEALKKTGKVGEVLKETSQEDGEVKEVESRKTGSQIEDLKSADVSLTPMVPKPPPYICPSSASKSHQAEVRYWLMKTYKIQEKRNRSSSFLDFSKRESE